jgi:heat shock protein HslJ
MKTNLNLATALGCVVSVALAMTACTPADENEGKTEMTAQEPVTPAPLEGRTWVLVAHGDPTDPKAPVASGKAVTATFDALKHRVSGNATCNQYFAQYSVDGEQLEISNGGSTQMACLTPELADQEQAYLAAIERAETFEIDGDALRITCSGGQVLDFVERPPAALEGTEWAVTGFNNGKGGVVSVLAGTELSAVFSDGGYGGSSGCNTFRGEYEIEGDTLRLGPAAGTRKMCARPDGIMEQEDQFLAALATVATYRIDGDTLELRREGGALAVKLRAKE